MLSRLRPSRAFAIIGLTLVVLTGHCIVRGQDMIGGASRTDLSGGAGGGGAGGGGAGGGASGGGGRTTRRPAVKNKTGSTGVRKIERPKTVVIRETIRTLSVATSEPGAALLVEPIGGGESLEAQMDKEERLFVFPDVKPGRYRVAAELDGYTGREEEVVVLKNKPASVTLELQPITDDVTIVANIPNGEVRYATVVGSRDTQGEMKFNPVGQVSVIPLVNGRAKLPNLRPGTYGVDVRASEVGYQTLLGTFTLPGKTTLDVKLTKLLSTGTFQASWGSLAAWEAPAGWRVASSKLLASGRGVALPRNDSVRHYADFRLYANINMLNGVAASFAVRAEDAQNYYLIQITGANADEPYVLRGFVVKNGVPQLFGSTVSVSGYTSTIKQNKAFKVTIVASGNQFTVSITDQTGEVFPLGILEDPNRNFPMGAAGIAVRDNEQNEIDYFVVCTDVSPGCDKG